MAIGARAAREAYESGALGDVVLEGAEKEDVADLAADSIGFDEFLEERMTAAREALATASVEMAVAGSEEERLRISYLARQSYEVFVEDWVEEELTEQGRD